MSQSEVYVQALDGLLYKNPIISGEGWFVCFDDDEPPEIVMKRHGTTTEKSARRSANKLLLGAGIGFRLGEVNSLSHSRCFPPTWKPKPASSIFFTLLAPIPIPGAYGGVKITPAKVDASMYIFWHDFDTRVVLESILGISIDTFLCSAVLSWAEQLEGRSAISSFLKQKLEKQHPVLKGVTRENYERILLATPHKLRIKWSSSSATADFGS